jgi:hypothetical protein
MATIPYQFSIKPRAGLPIGWQVIWGPMANGDVGQPLDPTDICSSRPRRRSPVSLMVRLHGCRSGLVRNLNVGYGP